MTAAESLRLFSFLLVIASVMGFVVSLVRPGLHLLGPIERLPEARQELALAGQHLDTAEREVHSRTSWYKFMKHSRDAYRHSLRGMAIHLEVDQGGGPVDCANNVLQLARSSSIFPKGLPSELLQHVSFFFEVPEFILRAGPGLDKVAAQKALWAARHWSVDHEYQRLMIQDMAELIERPMPSRDNELTTGGVGVVHQETPEKDV
jgi:hypothetical protein